MIGKTISHYRVLEKLGGGGRWILYGEEPSYESELMLMESFR